MWVLWWRWVIEYECSDECVFLCVRCRVEDEKCEGVLVGLGIYEWDCECVEISSVRRSSLRPPVRDCKKPVIVWSLIWWSCLHGHGPPANFYVHLARASPYPQKPTVTRSSIRWLCSSVPVQSRAICSHRSNFDTTSRDDRVFGM